MPGYRRLKIIKNMSNENFPIQGHDWRKNSEKPLTTFQESFPITLENGGTMQVLQVHISDDPNSPLYFRGIPDAYLGGAVYRAEKAEDLIDNPVSSAEQQAPAEAELE